MLNRYIVIADTWNAKLSPDQQAGYTSRVSGRVGIAIQQEYKIPVFFFGAVTDYDYLMDLKVGAGTGVLVVRNQEDKMLPVAHHFLNQGAAVFVHLADPHSENKLQGMEKRAALQRELQETCTGVIATSRANKAVGLKYNRNTHFLPDSMDADKIAGANGKPSFSARSEINVLTTGYPFHHIGFYLAAREIAAYAKQTGQKINFSVCTKFPNESQRISHKPVSGFDCYGAMEALAAQGAVTLLPFSVDALHKAYRETDLGLIPNDPLNELNIWQQERYLKRGTHRVVDGLAYGKPVLAIGQNKDADGHDVSGLVLPDSYKEFTSSNAILAAPSLAEGLDAFCGMMPFERVGMVQKGQEILRKKYTPEIVAKRYHEVFSKALG
jgi:hypothetical protein